VNPVSDLATAFTLLILAAGFIAAYLQARDIIKYWGHK